MDYCKALSSTIERSDWQLLWTAVRRQFLCLKGVLSLPRTKRHKNRSSRQRWCCQLNIDRTMFGGSRLKCGILYARAITPRFADAREQCVTISDRDSTRATIRWPNGSVARYTKNRRPEVPKTHVSAILTRTLAFDIVYTTTSCRLWKCHPVPTWWQRGSRKWRLRPRGTACS